jgi:hypothetical protein
MMVIVNRWCRRLQWFIIIIIRIRIPAGKARSVQASTALRARRGMMIRLVLVAAMIMIATSRELRGSRILIVVVMRIGKKVGEQMICSSNKTSNHG